MSELDLWIVSWNMEQGSPSDAVLEDQFVIKDLKAIEDKDDWPAVIAIGLQEAPGYFRRKGKLVGERVCDLLKKDDDCVTYKQVAAPIYRGVTKAKGALTQLSVLVREDMAGKANLKVVEGMFKRKAFKSKGGVCAALEFTEPSVRVGLVNCHLESKTGHGKGLSRNKEIVNVLKELAGLGNKPVKAVLKQDLSKIKKEQEAKLEKLEKKHEREQKQRKGKGKQKGRRGRSVKDMAEWQQELMRKRVESRKQKKEAKKKKEKKVKGKKKKKDKKQPNAVKQRHKAEIAKHKLQTLERMVEPIDTALRASYDAVFFFGDLNYRLYPDDEIDDLFHTEEAEAAAKIDLDIDPQLLSTYMASSEGREILFNLDGLNNISLQDEMGVPIGGQLLLNPVDDEDVAGFGFEFPPPETKDGVYFLPSYKLDYKTHKGAKKKKYKAESAVVKLDSAKKKLGWDVLTEAYFRKRKQDTDGEAFYDCKAKQHERKGAFDLGWLDRIGYRTAARLPQTETKVKVDEFKPYEGFRLSDHAPVVMQCRVEQKAKG